MATAKKYGNWTKTELLKMYNITRYDINHYDPIADKIEDNGKGWYSVRVADKRKKLPTFWLDYSAKDEGGDWNQYIFHTNNAEDMLRQCLQDDNWVFEVAESIGFATLHAKGYLKN